MADQNSTVVRAIIVDDHRMFNDGLKSMLADEPTIEIVGQVYRSNETPYAVTQLSPDILLMDFNMPGTNGLDMTAQLLNSFPKLNILILSMYGEQRYIDDFQKAGAKGYLLKTADVEELVNAVRIIMSGNTYFIKNTFRLLDSDNHANDGFIKKIKLTPREVEVIDHIRQGLTNHQIADVMNVSFYTVETHRRNIHLKLGVKSTAELLRFLEENK